MVNRFIPASCAAIVEHLTQDFFDEPEQRIKFRQFARLTEQLMTHFAQQQTSKLRRLYNLFNPDTEYKVPNFSARDAGRIEEFFEQLHRSFTDAGFHRLSDETFEEISKEATTIKSVSVNLNLPKIERFVLYHRGSGHKAQVIRPIRQLFRKVEIEIPTYSRVAVVTRTRDDPFITCHMYKDVAQEDVELLLPTVDVRMKLLDQLKLSGASGSAFISAIKLLRTMFIHVPKFLALPFKVVLLPVLLIVAIVYGGKAFLDYSKIRQQYLEALRENLFELRLASNESLIAAVGAYAGEELAKSVLLGYAFLQRIEGGVTLSGLSKVISDYANEHFLTEAEFDIEECLRHLKELNLLKVGGPNLEVISLDEAIWTIDHIWDELYEAPESRMTPAENYKTGRYRKQNLEPRLSDLANQTAKTDASKEAVRRVKKVPDKRHEQSKALDTTKEELNVRPEDSETPARLDLPISNPEQAEAEPVKSTQVVEQNPTSEGPDQIALAG